MKYLLCGIVLILGFIIFINLGTEKSFNKIELNSKNVILNVTDTRYLDTIIDIGINQLDVKGIHVIVVPLTEKDKKNFSDGDLKAKIVKFDSVYYISIDKLNRRESIKVLSHELIHLKQYYMKKLVLGNNYYVWNSDTLNYTEVQEYNSRPWEIEAFDKQKDLEELIVKKLY